MLKRRYSLCHQLSFTAAAALVAAGCAGLPEDDSAPADALATADQALGTPTIPCPAINIKYEGSVVATSGVGSLANVRPVSSISFGASKMVCALSAFFTARVENWQWAISRDEFANTDGDKVNILDQRDAIIRRTHKCAARSFSTSATGWGGIGVSSTARARIRGRTPGTNVDQLLFDCEYDIPNNSAYVHQDRPSIKPNDVLVAGNRGFYTRPALTSSEIAGGCNNVCNQKCTFNLQPGGSGDAIAKCINDCVTLCKQ